MAGRIRQFFVLILIFTISLHGLTWFPEFVNPDHFKLLSDEWEDIYSYATTVIPIIRKYSPDSVVLVGTPTYDRVLAPAVRKPIPYDNIMYSLHSG